MAGGDDRAGPEDRRDMIYRIRALEERVSAIESQDFHGRIDVLETFMDRAGWTWTIARHSIAAGGLLWALIVWLKKYVTITTSP